MIFRKVPNYIVKARASYQLVRGVPVDCQTKVGKKKLKEGGGKTLNEARERLPGFLARTDALIAQARGEQLTNEELVIRQGDHAGISPIDWQKRDIQVGMYLDDGTPNPEFESILAMAEAVKAGKANALLSTDGLLQARRLDREPAPRTFQGWVKALNAFLAFTDKSKPFQCTRADAVAYKDALLTRMGRSSTKTQLAYLAGLWTTLVEKQGAGEHIFRGLPGTLDETTKAKHSAQHRRKGINLSSRRFHTSSGQVRSTCLCFSCCISPVLAWQDSGTESEDIHDDYISVEWQEERSLRQPAQFVTYRCTHLSSSGWSTHKALVISGQDL